MKKNKKPMDFSAIRPDVQIAVKALLEPYGWSAAQLAAALSTVHSTEKANRIEDVWITRAEAARFARVSTDTVDNWCQAGYIFKKKLNTKRAGRVLISMESLKIFISSLGESEPISIGATH